MNINFNDYVTDDTLSTVVKLADGSARLRMYEKKVIIFKKVYKTFRGAKQAETLFLKKGIPASAKKPGYDIKKLFDIVDDAIATDRAAFHEPRDNSKLRGIPAFNLAPGRTFPRRTRL